MNRISSIVIKGDGRAAKLGYPTANLTCAGDLTSGVYIGSVEYDNMAYKAVIFFGRTKKFLEAHLLNFSGDLYGQRITVEIGDKIREVMDFKNDEELIKQIKKDVSFVARVSASRRIPRDCHAPFKRSSQ